VIHGGERVQVKTTDDQIYEFCNSHPEIIVAYLFGSQATGKSGLLSDIDLAFLLADPLSNENYFRYGYKAHLTSELIKLFSNNDIDVVILNDAPPLLRFQVVYHGQVIFSRSEKERLAFHVKVFNEYQDFRPFLAVQNQYFVRRLREKVSRYSSR